MSRTRTSRFSKRLRAEERRRSARRRRAARRLQWGLIVGAVVAIPVLALLDCTGPEEVVNAEVIRTQRWTHVTPQGGQHAHVRAVLEIEGRTKVSLDRADGLQRGQWVPVWIRRGRVSGWPYFEDLVRPGEVPSELEELPFEPTPELGEGEPPAEEAPEPAAPFEESGEAPGGPGE